MDEDTALSRPSSPTMSLDADDFRAQFPIPITRDVAAVFIAGVS